jgi:hypothetical protein
MEQNSSSSPAHARLPAITLAPIGREKCASIYAWP